MTQIIGRYGVEGNNLEDLLIDQYCMSKTFSYIW